MHAEEATSNRKFEDEELGGQPQSFHACEERSISQSRHKHACLGVRFGFKKKIGIYQKIAFQLYSFQ
jgi:hypothetical protein